MKNLLHKAFNYYGIEEVPGEENNPLILDFFHTIGHEWVQTELTAWCSAFINYLCKKHGYERSGRLDARSWLRVGMDINIPQVGCIVVLWRESITSWKGHVGFYINQDDKYVYIYGGNQDNSVCIKRYPIDRVLGYRKLKKL